MDGKGHQGGVASQQLFQKCIDAQTSFPRLAAPAAGIAWSGSCIAETTTGGFLTSPEPPTLRPLARSGAVLSMGPAARRARPGAERLHKGPSDDHQDGRVHGGTGAGRRFVAPAPPNPNEPSKEPKNQILGRFSRLRGRGRLPTLLSDERWSTQAVERRMIEANLSRRKRAARVVDAAAAAYSLQGALGCAAGRGLRRTPAPAPRGALTLPPAKRRRPDVRFLFLSAPRR
jgi:hypothetical protein